MFGPEGWQVGNRGHATDGGDAKATGGGRVVGGRAGAVVESEQHGEVAPGSLTNHRDARGIDAPDSRIVDDAIHGLLAIVPLRWEGTGRAGAVANAGDCEATVGQPEDGAVSP
jgi:hypothetical protein